MGFTEWLLRTFGPAVLEWTVRRLVGEMALQAEDPPHGASCECHACGTVFDDDELGIDPEAEGY